MRNLLLLAILAAGLLAGCSKSDDKAGAPVQPGDYAAEPGKGK